MTPPDVLWPGQHRAAGVFGDGEVVAALVEVEAAWARALEGAGLAEPDSGDAVAGFTLSEDQLEAVCREAEGGGNPVIPLLARLRHHVAEVAPGATPAVHRGLTSQDVLDSALMLCTGGALGQLLAELDRQVVALAGLARAHRDTLMAGRTLGQHALPTTFGAKVAGWLRGILVARDRARACHADLPAQAGGAVGTLAATVEACREAGASDPVASAHAVMAAFAAELGLASAAPWHTVRQPVTGVGDVLVTVSDAMGHIANDVVLLSRPEIGELAEPAVDGRGVSSAMPQKRNPVLSLLIRRQAQSAPLLGAQLHLASAAAVDERPDGAWHTEWTALRDLVVRTLAAARQATELLEGLEVDADAMRANLDVALPGILSERLVPALASRLGGGRLEAMALVSSATGVAGLRADVRARVSAALLSEAALDDLLDPASYVGISGPVVDDAVKAASTSAESGARPFRNPRPATRTE